MSEQRCSADVMIAGAGISGWMLAALLANQDLSVVVLEQQYQQPRNGSFAGIVTDADFDALRLGRPPVDRLLPLRTVREFELQDNAAAAQRNVSGAFTIRHDDLLAWLRSIAVDGGVRIEPDTTVTDFQWSGGAVSGIVAGPLRPSWTAGVVVLADESDPRLAEVPGLRPDWPPAQLMHIAKQRFGHHFDPLQDARSESGKAPFTAVFSGMTGWEQAGFGTLIAGEGSVTLGVAMLLEDEMTSARHIREFMDEVRMHPAIAPAIEMLEPMAFVTEVIPIGGVADPPRMTGDGVLAIGDIAGLTHPLNRDGLSANVDVAKLAAETIADAARVRDFSSIILSRLDDRVREHVVGPVRGRARAASLKTDQAWLVSSRFEPFANLGRDAHHLAAGRFKVSRIRQPPVSLRNRLKGLGQRVRHSD